MCSKVDISRWFHRAESVKCKKVRLVSALSGRFKDLEVLREEKLTKTLRKNDKLAIAQTVSFFEAM